jgi:murein DD-endopeptidase MepM/ murein hydrolase activator NlpD
MLKKAAVALIVAAFAGLVLAPIARPALERAWFVYSLTREPAPEHLPNPVPAARARRLVNSWGGRRAGGRRHEGIDIFAPKDAPVVSTTRGLVTRVGTNRLGGRIVAVLGPGFEWHYYAHLDRYGAFREGDIVNVGDVIGYVGNTGNARGTPSHLHYGIYRGGVAGNPYPRLTSAGSDVRTARKSNHVLRRVSLNRSDAS